jgi:hypothetical protein
MKHIFAVIGLSLFVAACNAPEPTVIQTRYVPVQVPAEFFKACPSVSKLPSPATLRDIEVAKALEKAYSGHTKCKAAIEAIRKYLDAAEQQFSQPASQ